jgi:hypothetical protein
MIRALVAISSVGLAASFMAQSSRPSQSSLRMEVERSIALPFDKKPVGLDGTLAGDAGFDPAGFASKAPSAWGFSGSDPKTTLKWFREAEITHGRIAQLAVLGFLIPSLYHFPGNPDVGVAADAYAELNPYKALSVVPSTGLWHIFGFAFFVESFRLANIIRGDKEPGDLGLGQKGSFNPFGFKYTEEEYFEKQVQEIKHGRLAMFGALGMLLQTKVAGLGVAQQLAAAFSLPSERSVLQGPGTLGDYFPPGV